MTLRPPCALAACLVLSLAGAAGAQGVTTTTTVTPNLEFGVGYQLLRAGEVCDDGVVIQLCIPDRVFPFGLVVDVTRNFGAFGIVGQGGWARDSDTDVSFSVWDFAGGLRWTSRSNPRYWPYGQLLVGVVRSRLTIELPGTSADEETAADFMLQPGVGMNFVVGAGWNLFGQVDFRHVFAGDVDVELAGLPLVIDGARRDDVRLFLGIRLGLE